MKKALLLLFILGFSTCAVAAIRDEEAIITTSDGAKFSARWMIPSGEVRAVVVILSGSGNAGWDGDVSSPLIGFGFEGKPAKINTEFAKTLAAHGVASLRYSKRGVDDPAQAPKQIIKFLKEDALTALSVIERRFPRTRTGLVGFSEGALVSVLAAIDHPVDHLFLLGLPSRPIDDILNYQFVQWPIRLYSRLDQNHDGRLSNDELTSEKGKARFALLGLTANGVLREEVDANKDGVISIQEELIPAYKKNFNETVMGLMKGPLKGWYESLRAVPVFSELGKKVVAKNIFIYHGRRDALVDPAWIAEDQKYFKVRPALRWFKNLGHCFSPMTGAFGEIRTSGPLDPKMLEVLGADVEIALK